MPVWPLYAALALGACLAAWDSYEVRPVGVALVASFLCSNAAQSLSIGERPAAYTVCEVMALSMAFLAHVCGAGRLMVALVAVSIVSIGTNFYMTTIPNPAHAQIAAWELATNLCFGMECLLVISSGLYDRTRDWLAHGRDRSALHGGPPHQAEADR